MKELPEDSPDFHQPATKTFYYFELMLHELSLFFLSFLLTIKSFFIHKSDVTNLMSFNDFKHRPEWVRPITFYFTCIILMYLFSSFFSENILVNHGEPDREYMDQLGLFSGRGKTYVTSLFLGSFAKAVQDKDFTLCLLMTLPRILHLWIYSYLVEYFLLFMKQQTSIGHQMRSICYTSGVLILYGIPILLILNKLSFYSIHSPESALANECVQEFIMGLTLLPILVILFRYYQSMILRAGFSRYSSVLFIIATLVIWILIKQPIDIIFNMLFVVLY
jgi:hypothetical protein